MCGLAGLILGDQYRSADDVLELDYLFTMVMMESVARGTHASGIAKVEMDGSHRLFKRPIDSYELVREDSFSDIVTSMNAETAAILGHTRFGTTGSEKVPENNHPIRTGPIIGTHNGHIDNASSLFATLDMPRTAEVDSEVLFRLAEKTSSKKGIIDIYAYRDILRKVRGNLTTVMISKEAPNIIVVVKGNNPLSMFYCDDLKAIVYASERRFITDVLEEDPDWNEINLHGMCMYVFNRDCLPTYETYPVHFSEPNYLLGYGDYEIDGSFAKTANRRYRDSKYWKSHSKPADETDPTKKTTHVPAEPSAGSKAAMGQHIDVVEEFDSYGNVLEFQKPMHKKWKDRVARINNEIVMTDTDMDLDGAAQLREWRRQAMLDGDIPFDNSPPEDLPEDDEDGAYR